MILFRGTTPEGKVVEGSFCIWQGIVFIFDSPFNLYHGRHEILPSSLAIYTTIDDKNGAKIWGSFEYAEGKMSEGGDRILYPWAGGTYSKGVVVFSKYDYGSSVINPARFICITDDNDENGPEINFDSRCEVIPKETENG